LVAASKKPITLVLFATPSCDPCERERHVIEKLAAEFGDPAFTVMTPPAGDFPELSVTSFPTIVLIGRDGKIVSYEVGARGESALREDLKKAGIGKR
jgi:thiol-disulfide isomerase/thioredoxin